MFGGICGRRRRSCREMVFEAGHKSIGPYIKSAGFSADLSAAKKIAFQAAGGADVIDSAKISVKDVDEGACLLEPATTGKCSYGGDEIAVEVIKKETVDGFRNALFHEIGHAVMLGYLKTDFPAFRRFLDASAALEKGEAEDIQKLDSLKAGGADNETLTKAFNELLKKRTPENNRNKVYKLSVTPYEELFADIFAAAVTGVPRISGRNLAEMRTAGDDGSEKNEYSLFNPARAYFWQKYLKHGMTASKAAEMLKQLLIACAEEAGGANAEGMKNYLNSEDKVLARKFKEIKFGDLGLQSAEELNARIIRRFESLYAGA